MKLIQNLKKDRKKMKKDRKKRKVIKMGLRAVILIELQ
ncbi:hypothetical protein PPRY_a1558 [Pseudoalteromonas prydzensis ACAM 620]|nr:hypothetical protein [Pseudoalteromonas prydzensis ACAM 620]